MTFVDGTVRRPMPAQPQEVAHRQGGVGRVLSAQELINYLFSYIAQKEVSSFLGPDAGSRSRMGVVPKKNSALSKSLQSDPRAKPLQAKPDTFGAAIRRFGESAKTKLSNPAAHGQPEAQLRAPLEHLIEDIAALRVPDADVTPVDEAARADIKTRPDYAVTVANTLVGFIELKAPGKGADPRRFKDKHDKEQWARLQSLPNLIYTDGNEFGLWRNGELVTPIVKLIGDIETAGADLDAPESLLSLFETFLRWEPIPPRDVKQLADTSARLCRLLREEVTEQLAAKNPALTEIATDWRALLFPEASDAQFADGYAQAVTFGMLTAKALKINLADGLDRAAQKLGHTLIGAALRILTLTADKTKLATSIDTLKRVLDVVDWAQISRGDPEVWLYFYEDFLAVYDNNLRKQTGSYYTPAQVVCGMVRLVDDVLRTRFGLVEGFASGEVTVIDPAAGTGTFLLGVLRKIAATVEADQGAGAVGAAIESASRRLLAFEVQLGPFAVAQLRLLAELTDLIGETPASALRMYVTDTLANPFVEEERLGSFYEDIAQSRRQANEIKKNQRIMVVLGNPPYKHKVKGRGGWVEEGSLEHAYGRAAIVPLGEWVPPANWGVSTHARHLRNLYVYFWRWATWKVFDHDPVANTGIVCFVSAAGFLHGAGFQRMRDYLRHTADDIWVIDCSPEGHQPNVNTRIFEDVQQPICIVLVSRSPETNTTIPARVRYQALPTGSRFEKFRALQEVLLDDGWTNCSSEWRAPFLPLAGRAWSTYVALDDLFIYDGTGVMVGRTWIIAPDKESLYSRWKSLISEIDSERKERLFQPHLVGGKPGDRHSRKVIREALGNHETRQYPVADDTGLCVVPMQYGFRSFDRQWIIPDNRLINRPNPEVWEAHSIKQCYLTVLEDRPPTVGPALTFTNLIPDVNHYNGRGGRVFPLWMDSNAAVSNVRPGVLVSLTERYERSVTAADVIAYVAAVAAHPGFMSRFSDDFTTAGLRVPFPLGPTLFWKAAELGRTILWLHTFGERFVDVSAGRLAHFPRLAVGQAPKVIKAIGLDGMPNDLHYDGSTRRLFVGEGYIDGVSPEVWKYEVSGKQVIRKWFSYRKADRGRPIIGDRKQPSMLGDIRPERWPSEYTADLINLLNVLGRLVELEPLQADLLDRICAGKTLTTDELRAAGAFTIADGYPRKPTEIRRSAVTSTAQVGLPYDPASAPTNGKTPTELVEPSTKIIRRGMP